MDDLPKIEGFWKTEMTLPIERTNAILNTETRVKMLTPYIHGETEAVRVPRDLLRQIVLGLKHYPTRFELNELANASPEILGGGDNTRKKFEELPIKRCPRCGHGEQ